MSFNNFKPSLNYPLEFLFLVGLAISLPILEAPKNIFWIAYAFTWMINRVRSRKFGGSWDSWDSLIAIWIISSFVGAYFAGLHSSEWGGANDVLRYGSILWLIKRSEYSKKELLWLASTLIASTMVALLFAFWGLYISHSRQALELNSVGHVNHSAIYLVISFGAVLSLLLAFWKSLSIAWRFTLTAVTIIFATGVLISNSRIAVAIMFALTFIIGIAWARRSRLTFYILSLSIIALAGIAYFGQFQVVKKTEHYIEKDYVLNGREAIWNSAMVAWEKFPYFGVGMSNYNQISTDKVKIWLTESGKPFDPSLYDGTAHAHSLYINALAERGTIGFAILFMVLATWLFWLARYRPKPDDEALSWALWGASFSAWFVTVAIGLVNTTLHHEHAILSVMLLGMWLAYLKPKQHSAV